MIKDRKKCRLAVTALVSYIEHVLSTIASFLHGLISLFYGTHFPRS